MIKAKHRNSEIWIPIDGYVNRGGWFHKRWWLTIDGGGFPLNLLVEADNETDAIDVVVDSDWGYWFKIEEEFWDDYRVGTDEPTCYFGGNNGVPCDLDNLVGIIVPGMFDVEFFAQKEK